MKIEHAAHGRAELVVQPALELPLAVPLCRGLRRERAIRPALVGKIDDPLDPCTTWPSHTKIGTEVTFPSRRVTARCGPGKSRRSWYSTPFQSSAQRAFSAKCETWNV